MAVVASSGIIVADTIKVNRIEYFIEQHTDCFAVIIDRHMQEALRQSHLDCILARVRHHKVPDYNCCALKQKWSYWLLSIFFVFLFFKVMIKDYFLFPRESC